MRIRHTVLLAARPDSTPEDRNAVDTALRTLAATEPHIDRARVSTDLGLRPGHPRGADWLFEAWFADTESFFAYLDGDANRSFVSLANTTCHTIISTQTHEMETRYDIARPS